MPTHRASHRGRSPHGRQALVRASIVAGVFLLIAGLLVGARYVFDVGASAGSTASLRQASPSPSKASSAVSPSASPGLSAAPRTSPVRSSPRHRQRAHHHAADAPSANTSSSSSAAASVLAVINQARAKAGLPAYTISADLDSSAGQHNLLMAHGCGLSHQCPGEPALGDRETAAGVHWTSAGENIGEGGPVSDTTAAITQMTVGLTQDMLNEKPPDDGHRLNLLSSSFTHVGIAIHRSSNGTVWMTQDFSN